MRKAVLGIVSLVFLLMASVLIVPLIVDIDKYRPEIVNAANERINGKIQIEKLDLSLWGQVKVLIKGLSVDDSKGQRLVGVGEAYAYLPLSSILSGAPKLTIKIDQPAIYAKKYEDGSFNLLTLIKTKVSSAKPIDPQSQNLKTDKTDQTPDGKVVKYITQSSIDLELSDSTFSFHDEVSKLQAEVTGFNVILKDVSMSKTMSLKIWSELSTKIGGEITLRGPLQINGSITPQFDELVFKNFSTDLSLNFDDVEINVPKTFRKVKGQASNIDIAATVDLSGIIVKKLDVHFLDLTANADASLTGLNSPPERLEFNLRADKPGANVDLNLKANSISAPDINLFLRSQGIDMDVLFPPSPEAIEERRKKTAKDRVKKSTDKTPPVTSEPLDVDSMLAPLKGDPLLRSLKLKADIEISEFKGFNLVAKDVVVKNNYRELKASLDQLSLSIFDGSINLSSSLGFGAERPTYDFKCRIDRLNLNQALVSQFETLGNTLSGVLSLDISGDGKSLNVDRLIKNLNARGQFSVVDAEFTTFDVNEMIEAGLLKAVEDIEKKYPQLQGKLVAKGLRDQVSRYKSIGGAFTMKGGLFKAPDFSAISEPEKGIDINGYTEVDMVADKLAARWTVVDTYNQTKLADISINEKGFTVKHILMEDGVKPVEFPITVGCSLSEPCFNYQTLPGHFIEVVKNNITAQAKGLLDAERAKVEARLEAEKKKLRARAEKERKKLEEAKRKKMAELERKKKEEERKVKDKAKEKLKKSLGKKFGF